MSSFFSPRSIPVGVSPHRAPWCPPSFPPPRSPSSSQSEAQWAQALAADFVRRGFCVRIVSWCPYFFLPHWQKDLKDALNIFSYLSPSYGTIQMMLQRPKMISSYLSHSNLNFSCDSVSFAMFLWPVVLLKNGRNWHRVP